MRLEIEDIQHFLVSQPRAPAARYDFLTFRQSAGAREWLKGILEKVGTAKAFRSRDSYTRWLSVAFTWNGLRALGVDETSLATFPDEFRQGMAARAEIIGATGDNHPKNWVGGLASPDLHAIVVLFARDVAERERCRREHREYLLQCDGVKVLSSLNLEATPPFTYAHEHFGYRDCLSQPYIKGIDGEPTPGSGPAVNAGEFFLGYPDENGPPSGLPQPEILSHNGSYLAYLRLEEHVGAFRDYLRQHGETAEQQEWIAAKLMGRWRSGAPLVQAPDNDDPELGGDAKRTNDFNYAELDPYGYGCPLGAHIRRMNPRDTATNMQRRRMIRRGETYGPPLPEGEPDDGVERGIAAFVGCASLARQFEFAMNAWENDFDFNELGNERDPIFGTQDRTYDMTTPPPIGRKITGLPSFTTVRGGAYFFLPGIRALRYLAALSDQGQARSANHRERALR
jgi:Dyp-type peroxidase family